MTFKSRVTIAGGDVDGDDDDEAAAKLDRVVGGGFPSAPDSAVSVLRPAARPRTGSETARSHHDRSIPQLSAPQCLSVSLGEHDEWYSVGVWVSRGSFRATVRTQVSHMCGCYFQSSLYTHQAPHRGSQCFRSPVISHYCGLPLHLWV